jgi:two-component system chemotaxis response regulator CheY
MVNVLLVDDAAYMRQLLKIMLSKDNHEVIGEAKTGTEGVAQYKELKPDLVILDITMPDMGGLDALKLIREHDPSAKVLLCTASDQASHRQTAEELDVAGYLVKPINRGHLLSTVAEICPKE